MAKFGWDDRRLFNIEATALENLTATPVDADSGQMLLYFKNDHLFIKKPSLAEIMLVEDGVNLGSDPPGGSGANIFKQKNASGQLEFRRLVSMDGRLDIVEAADRIELTIDFGDINDDLDHGLLLGLTDDDHPQYFLLAGRAGGQVAIGGSAASEDLELQSTSDATKGKVKIVDGSEFQHSDFHRKQYELQTTDATASDLAVIPLLDNKVYNVKAYVVARRSDAAGSRAVINLEVAAYREAGGAATIDGSQKQHFKKATGGLDADFVVAGNDLKLQVKGKALETYEWKAYIEYLESN